MMKELHFYIQSIMVLLALALAVQGPDQDDLYVYVLMIQFFLGVYQYGMSWFLIMKLPRSGSLLKGYFCLVPFYLLSLIFGSLGFMSWWHGKVHDIMLFGVPWIFAIYFIVVMEELLRRKPVVL